MHGTFKIQPYIYNKVSTYQYSIISAVQIWESRLKSRHKNWIGNILRSSVVREQLFNMAVEGSLNWIFSFFRKILSHPPPQINRLLTPSSRYRPLWGVCPLTLCRVKQLCALRTSIWFWSQYVNTIYSLIFTIFQSSSVHESWICRTYYVVWHSVQGFGAERGPPIWTWSW